MTETPQAQPENERPLTREDVLRLIKENGGTAQGLNLSGRKFEEGIDLSEMDLTGIILKDARLPNANLEKAVLWRFDEEKDENITSNLQGADLPGATLQGAHLSYANLQGAHLSYANLQGARLGVANLQGADLGRANLQGADLGRAKLQGAYLREAKLQGALLFNANLQGALLQFAEFQGTDLGRANLQGAYLRGAQLSGASLYGADISTAKMDFADWSGGYYVGEEKQRRFADAAPAYRALRVRYEQLGIGDTAGLFFYREKTAQRKACWSGDSDSKGFWEAVRSRKPRAILRALWTQRPLPWLGSMFLNLLFGYGERPWRVVGWWVVTIVVSSLAYFLWGGLSFWDALYYSLVSFPALGYGGWVQAEGWVRWGGPIEALWGVLLVALFLTTFVRKMTR